jgi:SOS-response transcriptional repressor LexA
MDIGPIIRQRRLALRLTQDEVAEQADISKPYLSNIETRRVKNPPTDGVLAKLEKALKFKPGELVWPAHLARSPRDVREVHDTMLTELDKLRRTVAQLSRSAKKPRRESHRANIHVVASSRAIPIINKVAAGYPRHFTDLDYPPAVADEYVRCPDIHDGQAFATYVDGDSMEPQYHDGDIVVFSPNELAQQGDDCFVRFADDGDTTFKRYYLDGDAIRLQPLNPSYAPKSYPRESINGLWPAIMRIQKLRGARKRRA